VKSKVLSDLGVEAGQFMLATAHRQKNVDNKERFTGLVRGLQFAQRGFYIPLIYPMHPRAKKQLELFGN
jgi:UDP-N-acetylglucosamine 2-epimerase (non-hydrolysing)